MSDTEESRPPAPTFSGLALEDDTIKILLATDNHVGYMERDPIRGQDSINTFREILQLAVKHDVDFILLAGDLFHENKPSRECLYQVTALLREYTLSDKPVQVELLSDPDEGKADGYSFPAVNYEDPNLNVGIPVFSIHGNHDDPQGAGAAGALCALDILSVSGLVNYMGKFDLPISDADAANTGIAVRPVLLRKGSTLLGLYGIGNVKDQRMHFELRSNRVRMFMPRDKDNWFNMLLLHQNRVKHGPQEYVPEGMFDDSVDLVIWGHEHDCRIVPEPVAGKKYYISQPGSSVATSLADGEAIEKHVALVQIHGKEFQLTPLPLRTVRPFVIEDITLTDEAEKEGFDIDDQMQVMKFLKTKVNKLIEQANKLWEERNAHAIEDGEPEIPQMLPLIRLKVDTTGVSTTSNPIRFGQEFQGRVANPRDLLVFTRAKKRAAAAGSKVVIDEPELSIDDPDLTVSEKLAKVRVGTLVREYLSVQELQLLGESGMGDAIALFVEKDDIHAIQNHVAKSLKSVLKNVKVNEDVAEEDLEDLLVKAKARQDKEEEENAARMAGPGKGKGKAKADEDSDAASVDSMLMDIDYGAAAVPSDLDMDSDEPPPPKKRGAAAKAKPTAKATKTPAKKAPARGKKKAASDSDEMIEIPDFDEDDDSPPPPPKKAGRSAVLGQTLAPAKKAPAKKAAASKTAAPKQSQLGFPPAGRSSRAAATKARGRMVVDDDDDD